MSLTILAHTNGTKQRDNNTDSYAGKPITDIIVNGFFTVDRHWTVQYWNTAAEKLLGVTAKEIVGKNLREEFADILPDNFYSGLQQAFLQDAPVHFEEYRARNNIWFYVITYHFNNMLSVSFKSSNRQINLEPPQAPVEQLKILSETYRLVTEITNDCLWEWNLQTDELFWIDGGHKRVFGYPIENALVSLPFWESRIHPADGARVLTRLREMVATGSDELWEDEYRFMRANGEYAYVRDRAHIIYDERHVALRMIGATLDITIKKETERQLIASEHQLTLAALQHFKELTSAVLAGQEKERASIGRELHDNLSQILGAAKMYIEMARTEPDNCALCLEKSAGYIVQVIAEIRRMSRGLVTPVMIMGLVNSINMLLDDLRTVKPIDIGFDYPDVNESLLDETLRLAIFRIVQEQLNNIVRHANATHVSIKLKQQSSKIILVISDNGVGYDLTNKGNGVGLINIRSRAEVFGGMARIVTRPEKGFSIRVQIPLRGGAHQKKTCE